MGMIYRATARQIKLNNSVMPVTFGYYAWLKEWEKEKVQIAGSGILVAPGIGLGAKHVSKGFERLDDGIEALQRRIGILANRHTPRPTVTQYAGLLYQAPKIRMPSQKEIPYWGVFVDWPSPDTDITVLQVEPASEAAVEAATSGLSFVDWQLIPPDRGSEVDVFGFPGAKISVDNELHTQDIVFRSETVRVVEVFDVLQAHGFTGFPGFQVDRDLGFGFSGGPVFYKGMLVGTFSGPNYVSALWPLLIHEYPYRDDNPNIDLLDPGAIRRPLVMRKFVDLFGEHGIHAHDIDEVIGRVRLVECAEALDGSEIETRCDKKHVVLRS